MMIDLGSSWTSVAIDAWVKANPSRRHSPERSLNKMVSAVVTQSFPIPTLEALSSHNYKLADFFSGAFNGSPCLS
jgi:serine/threonine-protein kinase SRPK3